MKNRRLLAIFFVLFFVLVLNFTQTEAEANRIITDMLGREVEVPEEVERVAAVGPGALRLVSYLESIDKLVGVEEIEKNEAQPRPYTLANESHFKELPLIGPSHGGDSELISIQNPDLVIISYSTRDEADRLQIQTGTPVVVLDYASSLSAEMDIYKSSLRLTAEVLGRSKRAEELIEFTEEIIGDLKERSADIPDELKPRVYLGGLLYRGTHGIVSTDPAYSPFCFVGANNTASSLGVDDHVMVDKEQLLVWDPELIFVDQFSFPLVESDLGRSEFQNIIAIREGELYGLLPVNHYTTNFASELANAYYVGKVLYPDEFADIDPEKKADRIYRQFVGRSVYSKMTMICRGFEKIKVQQAQNK